MRLALFAALILATLVTSSASAVAAGISTATDRQKADVLIPLIWKCMHVPKGAIEANARARLQIELVDGNLVGEPAVLSPARTPIEKALLQAAIDAVQSCNPYPRGISLIVNVTFDPRSLTDTASMAPGDGPSANWFSGLTDSLKFEVQADLVMTGDYAALVDGKFGQSTFSALKRFQDRHGAIDDGVLTSDLLKSLQDDAERVYQKLGMALVKDARSGLAVYLPTALLTAQSEVEGGTVYATADGGLSFSALNVPAAGLTLDGLKAALLAPEPGQTVVYSTVRENHMVVSGLKQGNGFYVYYSLVGDHFLGYSVNWTPSYAELGSVTAVFAASYAVPVESVDEPPPETQTATTSPPQETPPPIAAYPSTGQRVGAFLLPEHDTTSIVLDGDITPNTALDFKRALKLRPDATTVVLNSNGGSVTAGLLVAHDVHDRGLNTIVPLNFGCYSACAYVFFAGKSRTDDGFLGVHQIYGENISSESTQFALSDVLDALQEFGVSQEVISLMLRTPPDQVHVFTPQEMITLGLNRTAG